MTLRHGAHRRRASTPAHGYERSHVDGVWNTLKVLAGYLEADGVR